MNLAGNQITDDGLINLFDILEKSHHFEIEEVILNDNQIGKKGGEALYTFCTRFSNLVALSYENNKYIYTYVYIYV